MDPKQCTIWSSLGHKSLQSIYGFFGNVQSLFQDQTVSWIRILNVIDKFVREGMPIQEEDKASGNPLQKRDQY